MNTLRQKAYALRVQGFKKEQIQAKLKLSDKEMKTIFSFKMRKPRKKTTAPNNAVTIVRPGVPDLIIFQGYYYEKLGKAS